MRQGSQMILWHEGRTGGKKVPVTMVLVSSAKKPAAARPQEFWVVGSSEECE